MALLPDHSTQMDTAFLWVDLAGHLASVWRHVMAAAELTHGCPIQTAEWKLDVDAALETWRATNVLYAAFQDLGERRDTA